MMYQKVFRREVRLVFCKVQFFWDNLENWKRRVAILIMHIFRHWAWPFALCRQMLIGLEFFTHSWLGTFIKLVDGSFPFPGLINFPVILFCLWFSGSSFKRIRVYRFYYCGEGAGCFAVELLTDQRWPWASDTWFPYLYLRSTDFKCMVALARHHCVTNWVLMIFFCK